MLYVAIVVVSLFLDQLVKWWIIGNVEVGETILANPILSLTHLHNHGAAWSMLEGKLWFFYIITLVAVVVLVYMIYKNRQDSKWLTVGLSLILAGAIGNFIDRLHLKYVVDMFQLEFINFPIFNIADVSITLGVISVFIYIFFIAED